MADDEQRARPTTRVLLIDGLNDGLTIPVVRSLQRAGGYEVHCVTSDPVHDLSHSRHVTVAHEPFSSPEQLLRAVQRYHDRSPVDIVIPVHEKVALMTAPVADRIDEFTRLAPMPAPETLAKVDDKWLFHQLMESNGVRTPRSILPAGTPDAVDLAALESQLAAWGASSFLIKPTIGYSGFGIEFADTPAEIVTRWVQADHDRDGPFIFQEFIPGGDRDVSFLARDGEVIVHTIQEPFRAQYESFRAGLGLRFVDDAAMTRLAEQVAGALGWTGVAHVDARVDERTGEIFVLEVNPRYWQTLLGSLAMGVDFADLHCRMTLGLPLDVPTPAEGVWTNTHALSENLQNVRALRREDVRPVLEIYRREFAADPRLESYLIWKTLRQYARMKWAGLRARAGVRIDRRRP